MKNMKFIVASCISVAFVGFLSTSAFAQSAKFAASWDNDPITAEAHASCDSDSENAIPDCPVNGDPVVDGPHMMAETEMATIHIGTHKSIFIGVSSQIGIHLITWAKGKGGSTVEDITSRALASGMVELTVALESDNGGVCQTIAPSNKITLKSEMRELTVGATSTAEEVEVMVGIETNSISAHHFEFLGVECDQGTYKMTATFDLTALAEAAGYDASADVVVTLGDRMVTLQEVRAVKGSLMPDID